MKKNFLITIALLLTSYFLNAQSAKIENMLNFSFVNSGAIIDSNNDVDGYYFFYEIDKLKKGDREYAINIKDNELNSVATKKIINNKRTFLAASAYNNKEMLFMFINFKDKEYRLVGYDRKGNVSRDTKIPISKKEINWLMMMEKTGYGDILLPVDNKGFILTTVVKNKKMGYKIQFLSSVDSVKPWTINSPENAKEILTIKPIKTNSKYLIALEGSKKSMFSNKTNLSVKVLDSDTGKTLFKKLYTKENNPKLITNAFIEDDKIVLLGEYFGAGDNIMSAKSQGLFVETFDKTGTLLNAKKIGWKNQLFKKLQMIQDTKKNTYTYFHDIIKAKNGNYYAVGELYKKTASAMGIASMALSGGKSGAPVTQLTITDAVVYEFDKDFNLLNLNIYKKGKSRAPSVTDFGSPQLNAHVIEALGGFDFINIQTDPNSDKFYANFLDFNRFDKDKKGQLAFISVIYSDGKLTSDKINVKEQRRHAIHVLPAKLGHVFILDYDKKNKILNMHLEKMNIE
jgi:uncharacterized protein YegP (UPF0339 family)